MKFSNFREPIPEAYFPKLDSLTSARGWPPRQAGMRWQDLRRPADGLNVSLADMEKWRKNIDEVISTGKVRLVSTLKASLPHLSKEKIFFAHSIRKYNLDICGVVGLILAPNGHIIANTFHK